MSDTQDPCRVNVWPAVLSYPRLFVPERGGLDGEGSEKYSCELWFYANSPRYQENYQTLSTAVSAAIAGKWGAGKINPASLASPIKDLQTKAKPPAQPGFFVRANSVSRPTVRKRQPDGSFVDVTDEEEAYAGVIVACNLYAAGYDIKEKAARGVKFYLNQVILVRNGERLGRAEPDPQDLFGESLSQMGFEPIVSTTLNAAQSQLPGMAAPPAELRAASNARHGCPPAELRAASNARHGCSAISPGLRPSTAKLRLALLIIWRELDRGLTQAEMPVFFIE